MAKGDTIEPGYCVALSVVPQTTPDSCYIGLVEAVDAQGIRIALVHWDDKLDMLSGYSESLFVPWMNIDSILVSTEKQPTRRFMTITAPKWQSRVEHLHNQPPAKKSSK